MGKMKELLVQINEEFQMLVHRDAFPSEAQRVLDLVVNHDATVFEAVLIVLDT